MATVSCTLDRSVSLTRVLVVEDYERFRRFVCSTLGKRDDFKIVGEAADGLEAVHKAEELRPDLVLMDIGLPRLNGIEAARRIIALLPECKIVFLTQEDSAEVVEAALSLGAHGYVIKARAESELLLAVDAAREGGQFFSAVRSRNRSDIRQAPGAGRATAPIPFKSAPVPNNSEKAESRHHRVHFHSDDPSLLATFTFFAEKALNNGGVVVVIATESHRKSLLQDLYSCGLDGAAAREEGRYVALDVDEFLAKFMVNNQVDPARFFKVVDDIIKEIKTRNGDSPISACGECAATLWAQGNGDAAVQLELLGNEVIRMYNIDILCGYLLKSTPNERDRDIYERICAAHAAVFSR